MGLGFRRPEYFPHPTAPMSTPLLTTPLPATDLQLDAMTHSAQLSVLEDTTLHLLSDKPDLDPDRLLGQTMQLTILLRDDQKRFIHGYVTQFGIGRHQGRHFGYQARLRPWPWFLRLKSDCRIFQEMTVPDIVEEVFKGHGGIANHEFRLTRQYRKRDNCVQWRETDFNFVARLLEDEGIYWYFEHAEGEHKLVLVDDAGAHDPSPGYEELPFHGNIGQAQPDIDFVSDWRFMREVRTGKVALRSWNFETPSVSLEVAKAAPRPHAHADLEQYDFQVDYLKKNEGEDLALVRMDEQQARHQEPVGVTNAHGLASGRLFTLTRHPREDQNVEHLCVQCELSATAQAQESGVSAWDWRCTFTAMPSTQQFRPLRRTPKPYMQGPHTAIVTGPPGEELHTDKYGRVKVLFHWDRHHEKNEQSSWWIRVSHPWAGKGWGAVAIPRIGQEVIVDFIDGDPDQPIITGRVYNAECMPPYELPGAAVVSGLKSNTHKGKGFNAMTMDDTAGKEKISIHAQYDMDTMVNHDQVNKVDNTFTETIKSHAKITISEGTYSHDVAANKATYHVMGPLAENYDNTQTTIVKSHIVTKSTAGHIQITSDTAHVFVDAATKIKLHVGASTIEMNSAGDISIDGVNVAINGSSTVTIKGGEVTSEAVSKHQTKGGIVISTGKASNTVEGGMVMLNP
jgi:type VI secretion system secreted protein VgrG